MYVPFFEFGGIDMLLSTNYEIIDFADEYLAIPIGEYAKNRKDVYAFSKAAAFLIKKLKKPMTVESLADCLVQEYGIDKDTALSDVESFISDVIEFGLVV